MLVAGVDSSTQGCKLLIFDSESGEVVRSGRASHPPTPEIDPEVWYEALNKCIVLAGGLSDVSAISVAGQQHGMVALDKNGNVIRKAMLWNDTKSAPSAEALIKEIGGPHIYANRVGIVPVASFTASKLRYLRDNEPENAANVAAICLPHDWLSWRLMGYGPSNPDLEALITDRSDASGTAYWSGKTGKYDPELFKHALGRPMREARSAGPEGAVIVPRVLQPNEVAGKTPEGLVVGAGAGDNAGGALGLNAQLGDIVVSLGTSGAVFSPRKEIMEDPSGVAAGFSDATGLQLPLVCTLNGARVLSAASSMLQLENPNDLTPLANAAEPGSGGLVLLPYFEGERTPNLPTAKASMHNMTLANMTPPNLARAFIESLICSMAQAVRAVTNSQTKKSRLYLIGGASANIAVQEIASQVFDVNEIYVPEPSEYVARGAGFQAAWALTQKKPSWEIPVDRVLKCVHNPEILEQYEAAQFKEYPELK